MRLRFFIVNFIYLQIQKVRISSFIADSALITHNIEYASKKDVNRVFCAFTIKTKKKNGDN